MAGVEDSAFGTATDTGVATAAQESEARGHGPSRSLNHLACFAFLPPWWDTPSGERRRMFAEFVRSIQTGVDAAHFYLCAPLQTAADFLVWTAARLRDVDRPRAMARELAEGLSPYRRYIQLVDVLWGLTRPSQYSRAKSQQEIDPFSGDRDAYLVIYPFSKTAEWYLLGREARQGMMNEHIRIGKQYREISQLLLYSFGLQDQEFVVAYEMNDLALFSDLVYELRDTDARVYTSRDTPLRTGVSMAPEDLTGIFAAETA